MEYTPIPLDGSWDEGVSLDLHTISSIFTGDNIYGRPTFDTRYSELGGLLNLFKYKGQYDKVDAIIEYVRDFFQSWKPVNEIGFVLSVPPTNHRLYQPAEELASRIAKILNVNYSSDVLGKISQMESKALNSDEKNAISGSIVKTMMATTEHNVLLVDDIYDSGATLNECVQVLRKDPLVAKVFVLTITKTRKG